MSEHPEEFRYDKKLKQTVFRSVRVCSSCGKSEKINMTEAMSKSYVYGRAALFNLMWRNKDWEVYPPKCPKCIRRPVAVRVISRG